MQGLIDSGKYKVIEVLRADGAYEACLCIDVMVDSGYRSCLINTYKSRGAIKELLPLFYDSRFQECSCFRRLITADGSVSVVFDYSEGEPFDEFFGAKTGLAYEERAALAHSLMKCSLELDLLDDRLAQRVLDSKNFVVSRGLMQIGLNYMIPIEYEPCDSFRSVRLGGLLSRIFPQDKYLPIEIDEFIIGLLRGEYKSCVEAYSGWRTVRRSAEETLKNYQKESALQTLFRNFREKKRRNRKKLS